MIDFDDRVNPKFHYIRWFPFFSCLEMIRLDKSGYAYKMMRKILPQYLNSEFRMPREMREFIAKEMTRDRPFYPDKGKGVSFDVMLRSMNNGFEITTEKEEKPLRSIYNQIIPKIAEESGMSIASVKKDYEQRFLPVYKEASIRGSAAAKKHQALLDSEPS